MAWIGQGRAALLGAASGLLVALASAVWMWGFTVDDALIPVRYARHLADGAGYRFNAGGPVTDGVTPLPWAILLSPLAHAEPLVVLMRAKYIGFFAWLAAAGVWGSAVVRAEAPRAAKAAAFAALLLCVPVAAHAVSGMETALAMALATVAATCIERPLLASGLAGLAASLRPEMAPWAVVLALGVGRGGALSAVKCAALAFAPFAACAALRVAIFGHAAPLAVMAKPSDLDHGLSYAVVAALVTGGPILALAPLALRRAPREARALAVAGLAHLGAIAAVGGDWMPYARLLVPIVPSLLLASVLAAPHARRASLIARAALALGFEAYIVIVAAPAGRHVARDRVALIDAARPYLQNAHTVAALDVGWVSAATEAQIVDLAGLTDPTIAALPGGHTSKRVDPAFFLARDPDVLLVYSEPRLVEARLVSSDLVMDRYDHRAFLPLGTAGRGYDVFVRR